MYKKHILSFTVAIILLFTQVVILAHEENQSTSQSAEIPYEEVIENNSDAATSYNDTIKTEIENLTEEYIYKYIVKKTNNRISDRAIDKAYSAAKDDKVQEINELKQTNEEEFTRLDLDNSLEDNKIAISEDARNILKSIDDTEAYNNDINVQDLSEDIVVLELPESVKADVFVEKFLSETKGDIEYIQPDYKLEISDFDENSAEKDDLNLNIEENKSDNAQEDIIVDIEIVGEGESNNDLGNINQDNSSTSTPELSIANPETPEMTDNTDIIATQEPVTTISPDMDVVNVLQDDIQSAWQITKGSNVRIAVIDSKIDVTHPDLSSHITNGFDVLTNSELIYNEEIKGQYYHGTHVTGIIASTVPDAEIIPITAFNDGQAYTSDLIKAIEYAKEQGADIVNCSWGSADDNPALKEAMQDSGMLFVCAAGNNRMNVDENAIYPACFDIDNVISVTSLNQDLGFSYYSNYGESVDIAMYGRNVNSTLPGGEYGEQSGTSMAAAYVTVGAAMLKSVNSEVNIKDTVIDTAVSLSNLQNKVKNGKKLCYANLVHNIVSDNVIEISPEDDFDVDGYERTPAENWELFSSIGNKQVVACGDNTYFLKNNGTVWASGDNSHGQLGNGTNKDSSMPVQVYGLFDIKQITAGYSFCIALCDCGWVWEWGNGRSIARHIEGTYSIAAIYATYINRFAIKADGTMLEWGENSYGSLGNGTKDPVIYPIKTDIEDIKQIVGNSKSTLFLTNSGKVLACGSNEHKFLGDKSGITQLKPVMADISNIQKISCGTNHVVALTNTGLVYSWGNNNRGQLCISNISDDSRPIFTGLYDIVDIAAGGDYTIIIKNDGSVWSCGYNYYGQLGKGDKRSINVPEKISKLGNINEISLAYGHAVALDNYGNIWIWGKNDMGQFGNSSYNSSYFPITINKIWDYIGSKSAAGKYHYLEIKDNGTIFSAGDNEYGQLGDGTNQSSDNSMVSNLTNVKEVAAGDYFSVALKNDGTVWTWGINDKGQLGNGTIKNSNVPIQILSDIASISAGKNHVLAVTNENQLKVWGSNEYGQLGYTPCDHINVPQNIINNHIVKAFAGGNTSFYLCGSGGLYGCGKNDKNQVVKDFGPDSGDDASAPIIDGFKYIYNVDWYDILDISVGENHTAMLDINGNVYTWGDNALGQLGAPSQESSVSKVPVSGIVSIKTKYNSNFAIDDTGAVFSWGDNTYRQLGYESENDYIDKPEQISDLYFDSVVSGETFTIGFSKDEKKYKWGCMPFGSSSILRESTKPLSVESNNNFIQIEAKRNSVIALDVEGNVYTWGDGSFYDLGHENQKNVNYPKKVAGLPKIVKVAKGKNHTLALDENGYIWGWGNNSSGELGDDLAGRVCIPTQISGIDNVIDISAGTGFSAVVKSDGTVWTWGNNNDGELGERGNISPGTPGQVLNLSNVSKISCGDSFIVAISENTLYSWGCNNYGQLGNGTFVSNTVPQSVSGKYIDISAGNSYVLAIGVDHNVYSWGRNSVGQLGLGDKVDRLVPTLVLGLNNIIEVEASDSHSIALTNGGIIYTWGEGRDGQLGNDSKSTSRLPLKIDEIDNIRSITSGSKFSIFVTRDGNFCVCGQNEFGQLGLISCYPVEISLESSFEQPEGQSVTIEIISDQEYVIVLSAKNISNIEVQEFTFEYDSQYFELIDATAQTYGTSINIGIESGDVKVTDVQENMFKFQKVIDIPNLCYSGFLNSIKFKAKKSGTTELRLVTN